MRRIQLEVLLEGDETIEQLAEMCELSVEDLIQFNPRINRYFDRGWNGHYQARVGIKLCKQETYPASFELAY